VLELSVTVTDATGTGDTVTEAVPLWPSLMAVIVAVPGDIAVTSPVEETVAIASLLEDHVTRRESRVPWASVKVTLSCSVPPCTTVALDGLRATDATGACVTVSVAFPVLPSLVAVIDALPAEIAVTSPDAETVAIAVLAELQVTTRPVRTLLLASRVVADNCCVPPI